MIADSSGPAASPANDAGSFAGATISFVAPHIPGFVKRAVPQLGVFRPAAKSQTAPANCGRPRSNTGNGKGAIDTTTPPPSYAETLAPFFTRRFQRNGPESAPTPAEVHAQATPEREQETIHWKYANQGVSLLQLATQESTGGPSNPFTRQLYIHAMTYLLRALPFNLSEEESTSITAALPPSLIPEPQTFYPDYPSHSAYEDFPDYTDHFDPNYATHRPSLLYRITARLTLQIFITIRLILPWLQLGATKLYHLNREYHVTERLFNTTLSTADLARRGVWALSTALLSLQDGRVARLLEALLSWVLQSLSGGVYDGVGEGMAVLGLRQQQQQHQQQQHVRQQQFHHHPGYARQGYHSRGHSRNLSQHSVGSRGVVVGGGSPFAGPGPEVATAEYYQLQQVHVQGRVRAGSLRVSGAATASTTVGPSERTLRKARSHEVMRGGGTTAAMGAGSSGCYSPAKSGMMRMRPGLKRVDEGFA